MMKKLTALILMAALLLSGCGGQEEEKAEGDKSSAEDTLTVIPYLVTESFDPYLASTDGIVTNAVFDYLFMWDDEGNAVPCLAESIKDEGITATVSLKKDIKFSDGTDFNADAVIYNYNMALESMYQSSAAYIASAEKLDDYTVKFTKTLAYTDVAKILASYVPIVSPTAYDKGAEEFAKNPVGTGAYTVESFDSETNYVKLVANEEYFLGAPAIKNIEIQVPLESASALIALENKEADFVEMPMHATDLEIADSEEIMVETSGGWSMKSLFLFGEPFLTDKNLALAVTHAVNKENTAIANNEKNAEVAENLFGKRVMGDYAGCMEIYQYDVDKAKEYLEKSDYNGETLTLDITSDAANVATAIQADLKEVGINVEIAEHDANTYSDLFYKNEMHMAILDGGVPSFGIEELLSAYCGGGYYVEAGLCSSTEEMDGYMEQISTALTPEERKEPTINLLKAMQENGTFVPLYEPEFSYAHSEDVKGAESIWAATTYMYLSRLSF